MKKATSKRDRKYGKKDEEGIKITKDSSERVVKLMVDHGYIMQFKNMKEAQAFMNKINKESERTGTPQTSFVII
jgi:hypothetical protein